MSLNIQSLTTRLKQTIRSFKKIKIFNRFFLRTLPAWKINSALY